MGGASAAAAAFGGVLPPGITGTNDRSTLLVSNLVAEVCFLKSTPVHVVYTLARIFDEINFCWQRYHGDERQGTGAWFEALRKILSFVQKLDVDKLFNIFSNYGNIVRIKMLHNKPDHALIQMGDGFQAELAFNYLKVCNPYNISAVWIKRAYQEWCYFYLYRSGPLLPS